jgi:hypothetical protein
MRNAPIDQIGTEHPLLKKLMGGRKKLMPAKQYSVANVRKGYGSNFNWTFGEAARTFNKRDTVDQAQFPWRVATGRLLPGLGHAVRRRHPRRSGPGQQGQAALQPTSASCCTTS